MREYGGYIELEFLHGVYLLLCGTLFLFLPPEREKL
jgi:hypothetical protein